MPDIKQMILDLMDSAGGSEEQKANVTDEFASKVDSTYNGDYKTMIKDLYQSIGNIDISDRLTDDFMGGVYDRYSLKKKSQASESTRLYTEPLQAFTTGLEGRTPEQKEEAKEAVRGISPLAYAEPIPYDVASTISDLKAQLEPSWKNLSKAYADKYAEEKANSIKSSSGLLSFANAMGMFSGDVMVGGDQFVPSAELAQLEKQVKNAGTAYKLLKDSEKWLSEPAVDKAGKTTWVGRFVDGIGNADWADILTMGATGLEYSLNVASIASKANEGGVDSLDEDEYSALVAYGLLQQARSGDKSMAYQGGRMVAEVIPFIIQFAYTGGIATAGKQIAKQVLKGMGKLGEKAITKALVKAGVTVGTGAIRSTLGASAPAAVAERLKGQVSLSTNESGKTVIDRVDVEPLGEAVVKGLASNAAEFIFEDAGKALGFIGKTKVGRWMGGIVPDSKVVDRVSSAIGYHGFIGQTAEEIGTAYTQAAITGDKPVSQAVGKDDLMLILVGTASMSGTMNAMKYGVAGAQAMSNSLRRRSEGLRPDLIQQINTIVEGDPDRVAEKLQELVNTEVSSKEELDKVVSYASALIVDVAAQETAGLGEGKDVMVEGTAQSKKLAIDAINDNNAYIGALLDKEVVTNRDIATIQELEEENSRLTVSLEEEVSNRFGKDARVEEIRAELDALYTGDVSGAALMEQAETEQGLRNELAGLLKEKRKVREGVVSDFVAQIAPEKIKPIQTTTEGEKVAKTVENEARIDDIERRRQEAKENPVPEPISYKEAVEEYKSTDLGSNEDAKRKKQRVVNEAQTKEGRVFVENQVAQLETNDDGTITVYRSGTMQEGHNPATTDKKIAEVIASERKKQGLSSDIIEVRVQPTDISAVIPGIESEVFIKVNADNKNRISDSTKKPQKTKNQIIKEKENVKIELDEVKQKLLNLNKDFKNGKLPFSEEVYNETKTRQEQKIKNLEWQLTKYDAELALLEQSKGQAVLTGEKAAQEAPIDATGTITEQIDAKETGKEAEVQEGEPVRVREPKKDGVEAETKKGKTLAAEATEEEAYQFEMDEVASNVKKLVEEQKAKTKKVKESHKAVKEQLTSFIAENRKAIDKVDGRRSRYITELVATSTPRTIDRRIASIEKILKNDAYAKKVMDTSTKLKKLQAKVKGSKADFDALKAITVKAKVTRKGQSISALINGIDASTLPENMLDDLNTLVDDLSKKVPDARNLKGFVDKYRGALQEAADMSMVSNAADASTVDAINNRISSIGTKLKELTSTKEGELDVKQIQSLKREARALASTLDSMVKNGDIAVTDDGVDIANKALTPLQAILDNDVATLGRDVAEAIAKSELEYKKAKAKEVLSSIVSNQAITEEDGKMLSELYEALGKVAKDERALSMLSVYDMDIIAQAVEQVREVGMVPVKLYQTTNKVKAANRYRNAKNGVFDLLEAEKELNSTMEKFLKKSKGEKVGALELVSDITTAQIVGIAKRVGAVMNNPIYTHITNIGSQAIIRAEGLVNDVMTPVFEKVNKIRRKGIKGAIKKGIYDIGISRKEMKVYDRIGILMNQIQFISNLKNAKGRVVAQADGTFTVTNVNGSPIQENGKTKSFTTASDAIAFMNTLEPEMLANGRALDYYDLVNYDYVDGKQTVAKTRRDSKLSKNKTVNNNELAHFDDAYGQLVAKLREVKNDNSINDLSSVRTEEDLLSLLSTEEQEAYHAIRDAFDSLYDKASAVAARDGKVLDKVDFYFTMMNKTSRADGVENTNETIDNIFSSFQKGRLPQLTGSIQERKNMMHYVDFNALRVLEAYVRDMAVSYEVLPVMYEQMEALNMVIKEYESQIKASDDAGKQQRLAQISEVADALRENVKAGYIIEFNRQKLLGDIKLPLGERKYWDVSKTISIVSNNVRNVILNKLGRVLLDVAPNSIKLGTEALGFKNPKTKAKWAEFFTHNRGSIPSIKINEQVNRHSMGGYEGFSQKGFAQSITDSWSGIGDNLTVFNAWVAKFPELYKKLSGDSFDLDTYLSDEKYRTKLNESDAFQQAKAMADGYVEEHTVPQTSYGNRKAMNAWVRRIKPTDKLFKLFQPMSIYTAKDAESFYANMHDLIKGDNAGRLDAGKRVVKVVVSNMVFNAMSQFFFGLNTYIAGAMKDDELLKEVGKDRMNIFAADDLSANGMSSVISLMLGKQMNLGRIMLSVLYNLGKGAVMYKQDKPTENRSRQFFRELEGSSGLGKSLMPLDLTKKSVPVDAMVNVILPFYGQQFTNYVKAGINMAEEMHNAAAYLAGDKQARTLDEQNMWSTINSANVLLASSVLPASSDVRQISDMMMKEYDGYGVSKELLLAAMYADDFILSNSDVNAQYDEMYDRTMNASLRKGLTQNEASAEARKMAEGVVDVYRKNDEGDYGKRLDFYFVNKEQIDLFRKAINVVSKSKMNKVEREKWYKTLNEGYAKLYKSYEQFAKGNNASFTAPSEVITLMKNNEVDDSVVRIYKSVYMLQQFGK